MHDGLYEAERAEKLPLRIAFVGLWCAADREGRFKWEPRRLGAQILPFDGVDFSRVLHALTTSAFIREYLVGVATFGAIPSWKKHQIINNRERDSEIPNPAEGEQLDACPTRDARVPHASKAEGKGREGNKEGKGVGRAAGAAPAVDDSEWLAELERNPAYASINIPHELAKMRTWCGANNRQPSRKRFVNWLNRCERPVAANAAYKPAPQAIPEPRNWREFAREEYPDALFLDPDSEQYAASWAALPRDYQNLISEKMKNL